MSEMIPIAAADVDSCGETPCYALNGFTTDSIGCYLKAGAIIKYFGEPNSAMAPLNAAAERRLAAWHHTIGDRIR